MKPILTKPMERSSDDEEDGYISTTPTSAKSRIPSSLTCPPAPKKRKAAAVRCHCAQPREFFCPPDLESIFIHRVEGA
ncbi:hypothetical protein SASPL_107636 [Salvia splendens]|uniref:Uncharacterized protein n=1 Tax=Salvia splendens TaxID=180675 RepID=A0A8X9A7H1_SALSN|nr:hypothetical protein SASPL_107636 [Salvia splendens]